MSKTTYIKSYLSKNFPITINEKILKQLIIIVKKYEIKDEHSLALNTPLLGINNILFVQSDRDILFGIFNKNEADLKKIIKEIPSINKDFIVISDTFNIFCTWVLYNIQKNNKISKRLQYDASFSLLNYFQYRFFSSIVNYYYPYKANEAIMSAVINNLNLKFDIAKYKTWKNVIYKRSENILDKHNIHYKTITTYEYDNDILYLISDTQTKIRNQIKVISNLFHEYKEKNNLINAYTLTANIDGETIIKDAVFIFDGISEKIFNQMVYGNEFVTDKYLILISKLFKILSKSMIRTLLLKLCQIAKDQNQSNIENKEATIKGEKIIIGLKALIREILKASYEYMISKNVNLNNKILVIDSTKKIYSYSRIANPDILKIKASINNLLKKISLTNRQSTLSSLSIVIPLYIVIKSFDFIPKK